MQKVIDTIVNDYNFKIETENSFVGKTFFFKKSLRNGIIKNELEFKIIGTQEVWGRDENNKCIIVDGFRAIPLEKTGNVVIDEIGVPLSYDEIDYFTS